MKAQSLVKLEEVKLGSQKISIVKMFSVHTITKLAGDFKFLWFEERLNFEKTPFRDGYKCERKALLTVEIKLCFRISFFWRNGDTALAK